MRNNFKIIILSIGLLFFSATSVFAIGQMSRPIVVENAVRGQEIVETLTLYSSENAEREFGLSADGDIKNWVKFYEISDVKFENPLANIVIPEKSNVNAKVIITVPNDTPNGTYEGNINLTSKPAESDKEEGSSASVAQSVGRQVTITVTDNEIIDFTASVIPEKYDVAKNETLKIRLIYFNQGNIKISPQSQVKIKTLAGDETLYNAIFPYPEAEPAVKPMDDYEITPLEIPTNNLANGKYWLAIDFLVDGKIFHQESFRFQVGRSGRILGAMFSTFSSGMLQKVGLIILVVLAVGLGMVLNNYRFNRIDRTNRSNPSARLGGFAKTRRRKAAGFWGKRWKEGRSWISGFFS